MQGFVRATWPILEFKAPNSSEALLPFTGALDFKQCFATSFIHDGLEESQAALFI
jgi:hypothetical protein